MQVDIFLGILIILSVWGICLGMLIAIIKFQNWLDNRNREPVVETKNIYDDDGNLIRQETYIDGVPRIVIGRLEEGF